MSLVAELRVVPVRKGSMAEGVARAVEALEDFDVSYETTPMGTVLESEDLGEIFAAAEAAHRAVDEDRVITSLTVDDKRSSGRSGRQKVEDVERALGREAKSG